MTSKILENLKIFEVSLIITAVLIALMCLAGCTKEGDIFSKQGKLQVTNNFGLVLTCSDSQGNDFTLSNNETQTEIMNVGSGNIAFFYLNIYEGSKPFEIKKNKTTVVTYP